MTLQPPNVVFVLKDFGFPNGMAATQRVRLLARNLREQGGKVRVLCTTVSEEAEPHINTIVAGEAEGIPFQYMPGKTHRASGFVQRRVDQIRGIFKTLVTLRRLRKHGEADSVYLWGTIQSFTPAGLLYRLWARLLGMKVVAELNERPWSVKEDSSLIERTIHPLVGLHGVVAISGWLESWARQEALRTKRHVMCVRVPILADRWEQFEQGMAPVENRLVFAASVDYEDTLGFILDAMQVVWQQEPSCTLSVTGHRSGSRGEARVRRLLSERGIKNHVVLEGYLARPELLALYRRSAGLLIPLFEDIRSVARFPTKLGEYLMSGRPVITTCVGEVAHFLSDGESAFICSKIDPEGYAHAILRAIQEPALATEVGMMGRRVACEYFVYSRHGEALMRIFGCPRGEWTAACVRST